MKTILSVLFLAGTILFISCKNNSNKGKEGSATDTVQTNNLPEDTTMGRSVNIDKVLSSYLDLKNALANDRSRDAGAAADEVGDALASIDETGLTTDQKKVFDDVKDDIKEHSDHISKSSTDISHQREHFAMLSEDIIDLVKAMGTTATLYRDFCPMYNNKEGAYWLSETKEIKNPYYGNKMLTCGEVKEEIVK